MISLLKKSGLETQLGKVSCRQSFSPCLSPVSRFFFLLIELFDTISVADPDPGSGIDIPYESLKQLLGLKILPMRIQIRDLYDPGSGMENSGTGINIGSATLDTIPTSFFHSYLEL